MKTATKAQAVMAALLCGVALLAVEQVGPRQWKLPGLFDDTSNDREATLNVVWGDGTNAPGDVGIDWYASGYGTNTASGFGARRPGAPSHWQKELTVKRGAHIILTATPKDQPRVAVSIVVAGHIYEGSAAGGWKQRAEVLSVP